MIMLMVIMITMIITNSNSDNSNNSNNNDKHNNDNDNSDNHTDSLGKSEDAVLLRLASAMPRVPLLVPRGNHLSNDTVTCLTTTN